MVNYSCDSVLGKWFVGLGVFKLIKFKELKNEQF